MRWTVYILECVDSSLYTGITTDLSRRIIEHETGKGARYTNGRGPFRLIHLEQYKNRAKANLERNRRILDGLIATNDLGQCFTLSELAERGLANPRIRRSELMVRVYGFELYANEQGHIGEFYTLTCPSRMHACQFVSGQSNPKFDGTTPPEAQKYLNTVWARIRAKLKRDHLDIYGFRIAEPQHDCTPHWHLLLFMAPEHSAKVREIAQHYAMQTDGDEPGAREHRFIAKPIDKDKGSAIGYIANSKNIDGFAIEHDIDGNPAQAAAKRVEAWASTWGYPAVSANRWAACLTLAGTTPGAARFLPSSLSYRAIHPCGR